MFPGDGDLDLAVGNDGDVNQAQWSLRLGGARLANNPPGAVVHRPDGTDDGDFFPTPRILYSATLSIPYTLFDPEGDRASALPEFSPSGGG